MMLTNNRLKSYEGYFLNYCRQERKRGYAKANRHIPLINLLLILNYDISVVM